MDNLYNQLRDLRKKLAEAEQVELFMVFGNVTIDEICQKRPKNEEELLAVKGMGARKVEKYGRSILALIKSQEISNDQFVISNEEQGNVGPINQHATESISDDAPHLKSPWKGEEQMQKQQVTVSQYLDYLNLVFQRTADVKVVGEVSGGKMYPSGYYFTLKDRDDETALSCYLPTYTYRGLGILVEDGMEVAIEGMPRMVKRNGRFQFAVENLELVGEGALKKSYDLLKLKLEEEGLFARKRELPEFVQSVGVITSRAGAVIHDFKNNLARLGIKVYLKDVRVEGASSPGMVIGAIKYFNTIKEKKSAPDVIVIMRGGGSMEDLQGFNNEQVVRAVFGSKIPTIVSIGHDKDVPLAQLAADIMVSTPTAAAHAVSATWGRLVEQLPQLQSDLVYAYGEKLAAHQSRLALASTSMNNWCNRLGQSYKRLQEVLSLQTYTYLAWITQQSTGLISQVGRISQMQSAAIQQLVVRVVSATSFLDQASPERQLALGYSIVKNKNGKVVRSVKDVQRGERVDTQVTDGIIQSVVE